MKPILATVGALCLILSASRAAPVPKDFRARTPNYFPMTVGDKREYAHPDNPKVVTQTREITAVETKDGVKHFTQQLSTGQRMVLKVEKMNLYVVFSGKTEYDPPYKACGPDMKEGDTWDCGGEFGMTRTVGKSEKITTPAGTFLAVPITIKYTKAQFAEQIVWYADGIGMVRQDNGASSLLLVKYTPGKETK